MDTSTKSFRYLPHDLLQQFVNYLRYEKKGGLAENTISRYLLNLRWLEHASQKHPFEIKTYPELARYIQELRKENRWSSSTQKNAADSYSVFYTWALRHQHIQHEDHPMIMGHEFKNIEKRQMDFFDWDSDDFKKLIYNPSNSVRDHAIMHSLRSSGIRSGALCKLKFRNPCDIFMKEKFFRCREDKGGKCHDANFDDDTADWLERHLFELKFHAVLDYAFQNDDYTKPLTPESLYKMIVRKTERLGIIGNPRKFRRSLGGEMLNNGAELTDVQHQLGHARVQTTADHYICMSTKRRRERYQQFIPSMPSPMFSRVSNL